jgi:uncharacterized protein
MDIVKETENYVKLKLLGEGSGHDWWHVKRVYDNSLMLLKHDMNQNVNDRVVKLGALLHDIADWKFNHGDEKAGPRAARKWLESQNVAQDDVNHVCQIIYDLSFKGGKSRSPMKTIEGEIVQDADRLDAIGAIGIARAFAYGGYKGQELYNPLILPKENQTVAEYKSQQTTTINHFFEKLLLLKDRMNTRAAKEIAMKRQRFMIDFLDAFLKENQAEDSWHAARLDRYKAMDR